MQNYKSYIGVVVAMIVWSSSFILTKIGLESFPPVMLVTIRITIAVALLFLLGIGTGTLTKIENKNHLLLFLVAGFIQPFGYFVCEAYGLEQVSPTVASVILSTIPVFTPLIAFIMIRERVSLLNIVGLVISLSGVLMILLNKGDNLEMNTLGLVCLFGAVLSGIIYAVMLRRVPTTYSNVTTIFYIHLFSLLFFIPTFIVVDLIGVGSGESIIGMEYNGDSVLKSLSAIVVLAAFASVMSFVLFCKAVRDIGATKANAFCNIMPISTALVMWFLFGEQLSWVKWIGIFVVIAGLFISQMKRKF